jgi:hypothetical protein
VTESEGDINGGEKFPTKLFSTIEGGNKELFSGLTVDVEGTWNVLVGKDC